MISFNLNSSILDIVCLNTFSVKKIWPSVCATEPIKWCQEEDDWVHCDHSGGKKSPIDFDLGCSVILPGQKAATVAAHLLPKLSELSQQEVFSVQNGHPVYWYMVLKSNLLECIPKGGADLGERLSMAVRGNLPLESVVCRRDGRTRLRRAPLPLVRLGMNDN